MTEQTELLIGGDFFVSDNYSSTANFFSKEITEVFERSNLNILNLEAPITEADKKNSINKTGPHLNSSVACVLPILKKLRIDLVTLANNHIMDYGVHGLKNTFKACQDGGIESVGAGMNQKEASTPYVFQTSNQKIAILNFAENEWSSSLDDSPGANPLDIIENIKQIQEAKKNYDVVIVIIHGGHEYYSLPSPRMIKQYRFYAENGASVVIAHHPHCISGYEVYQNVPIFYSLGNFLFTIPSAHKEWYSGLLLQLQITADSKISWKLLPVRQQKNDFSVFLLDGTEKQAVLDELERLSRIITDEKKLKEHWKQFLKSRAEGYLSIFSPANMLANKYISAGLRLTGLNKLFLRKKQYTQILNYIRCEAHADASKGVIENFLNK